MTGICASRGFSFIFSSSSKPVMSESPRSSTRQSKLCASSAASASGAGRHRRALHVAVADQLDDALALDVVVLDDQQVADLAVDEAGQSR